MYTQRHAGGFEDGNPAKPADDLFLNAVEDALLKLLGEDPSADEVGVWVPASGRFVFQKLTNANVDAAAAIARSKLDFGSGLTNSDIAAGASIAKSKLGALAIENADVAAAAAIVLTKLAISGTPDGTKYLRDDASWQAFPGQTLTLIEDKNLGSDTAEALVFNTGLAGYKHLMLVGQVRSDVAAESDTWSLRFNNDASALYDANWIQQSGGTASGSANATQTTLALGGVQGNTSRAGRFTPVRIFIPNYANTSYEKSCSFESGHLASSSSNYLGVGYWRSTAAITRVDIFVGTGTNFKAGTRLTLYGVN